MSRCIENILAITAITSLLLLPGGCDSSSAAQLDEDQFSFEAGSDFSLLAQEPSAAGSQLEVFTDAPQVSIEVRLPVLMYHHVGKPEPGASALTRGLTVSAAQFEEQMRYLQQAGYTTVSQYQLYSALYFGEPLPDKPVMLTLDDGFLDNYEVALPLLLKYGHQATFFVITDKVGTHKYVNWDQVLELDRLGMDIGSHTVRHLDLTIMGLAEREHELRSAAITLGEKLGRPVYWLCYPSGRFNREVMEHSWTTGYLLAYTTLPGETHNSNHPLIQPRWRVGPGTSMEEFIHLVD